MSDVPEVLRRIQSDLQGVPEYDQVKDNGLHQMNQVCSSLIFKHFCFSFETKYLRECKCTAIIFC